MLRIHVLRWISRSLFGVKANQWTQYRDYYWNLLGTYTHLLIMSLKLGSLQFIRLQTDSIMCHKIVNGLLNANWSCFQGLVVDFYSWQIKVFESIQIRAYYCLWTWSEYILGLLSEFLTFLEWFASQYCKFRLCFLLKKTLHTLICLTMVSN